MGNRDGFRRIRRQVVSTHVESLEVRAMLSVGFGPTHTTAVPNLRVLNGQVQASSGLQQNAGNDYADLVVGVNTAGGSASLTGTDILVGDGTGGFGVHAGPSFPNGSPASTNVFSLIDLQDSGDTTGAADLIYATENTNGNGVITLETNTGGSGVPQFQASGSTTIASPANFNPQQVLVGDFNADLVSDLAVLGRTPSGESLVVLTGDGHGGFSEVYNAPVEAVANTPLTDGVLYANGGDLLVYDPSSGNAVYLTNNAADAAETGDPYFVEQGGPVNLSVPGYKAGPMVLADYDGQGPLPIVAENSTTGGADLVVLFNSTGSGSSATYTAGQFLPAGNADGDAVTSLVGANLFDNSYQPTPGYVDVATDYGVLANAGQSGTLPLFSPTPTFATGTLTGAAGFSAQLTADLDGDGYLDLIGVSQANDTIVTALNTTNYNDQTNFETATTLTSSNLDPAPADPVTLTANVAFNGVANPTGTTPPAAPGGYVNFYDGSTFIGTAPLDASGDASLTVPFITTGAQTITATYLGTWTYGYSTSSGLTETVGASGSGSGGSGSSGSGSGSTGTGGTGTGGTGTGGPGTGGTGTNPVLPDASTLHPSLASAHLPPTALAGARINLNVPVTLTNTGPAGYAGPATVSLYASATAGIDPSQAPLATLHLARLSLAPEHSETAHLRLSTLPAAPTGNLYLVAIITDAQGQASGAASASRIDLAAPFTAISTELTTLQSPPSVISGSKSTGAAFVTLTNTGNVTYDGPLTIGLIASNTPAFPAGTQPFHSETLAHLALRPNVPHRVRVALTTNPTYTTSTAAYIIAQTTDSTGAISLGASAQTINVAPAFTALSIESATPTLTTVRSGPSSAEALLLTLTNTGNSTLSEPLTFLVSPDDDGLNLIQSLSRAVKIAPGARVKLRLSVPNASQLPAGSHLLDLEIDSSTGKLATGRTTVPVTVS